MEPEVHMIEKYLQTGLGFFTMTNIRCEGKKEIDLLAINARTGNKLHVESRVWTNRKLDLKILSSLVEEKFDDLRVKKKIREFFGDSKYGRWLVVSPQTVDFQLDEIAREKFGIEIKYIDTILRMIMRKSKHFGSRDHILRTLEIVKPIREFDLAHLRKIEVPKMTARRSKKGP